MERNSSVPAMRGFYVMRMKKDERTGHYFGVATWIARDQPIPGNRGIKTQDPIPKSAGLVEHSNSEHLGSQLEGHGTEKIAQVEDSRSEFNQIVEKFSVERKPPRSLFDPYDPYEL